MSRPTFLSWEQCYRVVDATGLEPVDYGDVYPFISELPERQAELEHRFNTKSEVARKLRDALQAAEALESKLGELDRVWNRGAAEESMRMRFRDRAGNARPGPLTNEGQRVLAELQQELSVRWKRFRAPEGFYSTTYDDAKQELEAIESGREREQDPRRRARALRRSAEVKAFLRNPYLQGTARDAFVRGALASCFEALFDQPATLSAPDSAPENEDLSHFERFAMEYLDLVKSKVSINTVRDAFRGPRQKRGNRPKNITKNRRLKRIGAIQTKSAL